MHTKYKPIAFELVEKAKGGKDTVTVKLSKDVSVEKFVEKDGRSELHIPLSEKESTSRRAFVRKIRTVIRSCKTYKIDTFSFDLDAFGLLPMFSDLASELYEMALQLELANYAFIEYKDAPKSGFPFVKNITFVTKKAKAMQKSLDEALILADEMNTCRSLCNNPASHVHPEDLGRWAESVGKKHGIKVTVLDEKKIKELGMGGLYAVGMGSQARPRFIVMEYMNGGKEKPIVFVGKGITFDSGGLNLKPSAGGFDEMHMDMSGGAAVIHALAVASRLKLKRNVVGLIAAAENMISGESYRPHDIITMMDGTTVEILNTDAEGRMVLADGLVYARKYKPSLVIDVATLTGASLVALGTKNSGLFTHDEGLASFLLDASERTHDFLWRLPVSDEYLDDMRGKHSDLVNLGGGRFGGASTAAAFLSHFGKQYRWAHLDVAPRMSSTELDKLAKGSQAPALRLFVDLMQNWKG